MFFSSTIAEPFPAFVVGDENKFSIVLGNLLSNAVRYNKAGGRVSFIAEHEKRGNSNFFRFTVSDTEIGFDERTYEKYIKPFRNSKTPDDEVVYGAGMGLAVAHGLVKLMGGTLHVRSVEDTGSTFWFEVPLQISDFVVPNDKEKNSALKGRCILVADDNSVNCEIVKRLLESYGCTVEITTNGKDAVSLFAASSPCHYDAILLDIRMPGMDGLEACRKIRALGGEGAFITDALTIPIIAMTVNALDSDKEKSIQSGMNAHISKSINPDELYTVLVTNIVNRQCS